MREREEERENKAVRSSPSLAVSPNPRTPPVLPPHPTPPPSSLPSPSELARGDAPAWAVAPPSSIAPLPGTASRRAISVDGLAAVLPATSTNADAAAAAGVTDCGPCLLAGRNVAALVYGATGSGKTHTMLGRGGLATAAVESLFDAIAASSRAAVVTLSFVELYNERPRDLLAGWEGAAGGAATARRVPPPTTPTLPVRPCPTAGAAVAGATRVRVANASEAIAAIAAGASARAAAPTPRNAASSRSHALLTLTVAVPAAETRPGPGTAAVLTLADLAGSEAGAGFAPGARRAESAAVNRSLLALGAVVDALGSAADDAAAGRPPRPRPTPWRDSKLTRLLQGALAGVGARVAVVATVAPGERDAAETVSTLSFAARAARVPVVSHVVAGRGGGTGAPPPSPLPSSPSPSPSRPLPPDAQLALDATRAEVDALRAAVEEAASLEARVAACERALGGGGGGDGPVSPRPPPTPARRSPLKWPAAWRRGASPQRPPSPPPRPRPPSLTVPSPATLARLSPTSLDAYALALAGAAEAVRAEAARRARRR